MNILQVFETYFIWHQSLPHWLGTSSHQVFCVWISHIVKLFDLTGNCSAWSLLLSSMRNSNIHEYLLNIQWIRPKDLIFVEETKRKQWMNNKEMTGIMSEWWGLCGNDVISTTIVGVEMALFLLPAVGVYLEVSLEMRSFHTKQHCFYPQQQLPTQILVWNLPGNDNFQTSLIDRYQFLANCCHFDIFSIIKQHCHLTQKSCDHQTQSTRELHSLKSFRSCKILWGFSQK